MPTLKTLKASNTLRERSLLLTELLKKAFEAVSELPPECQDALAGMILAEIEDEKKWSETFARSQDKLADMAKGAVAEHKAGKTHPMDEVL